MFRKTKKSLLSILISIVMVLAMVPSTAFAADPVRAYISVNANISYITYMINGTEQYAPYNDSGYYQIPTLGTSDYEIKINASSGYRLTDMELRYASSTDESSTDFAYTYSSSDYSIRSNSDDTTYWISFDSIYDSRNIRIDASTEVIPGSVKESTSVTLTADKSDVKENDSVKLAAILSDTSINEGSILFKLPDGDQKIIPVIDGKAEVVWTAPSSLVGDDALFKAVYLGSENYSQSDNDLNLGAIGSKTIDKTDSAQIVDEDGYAVSSLMAKTGYTLAVPADAVKDTAGSNLTLGDDYTITWYESRGGEFTKIGTGGTCNVTPDNTSYVYKAVVEPKGDYDAGSFELVVGCGVQYRPELRIKNISSKFEGQDVTIKADLTGTNGQQVIDIAGGTVVFYTADGGDKDAKLGEASVVDSQAEITFNNLPADDYEIIAYYTGVEGVYDSVKSYLPEALTIYSAALPDDTWVLTAEDEEHNVITDGMVPLETYTLSLATSDAAADLDLGQDYEIVWKMSLDNGLTWSVIDSSNYESDGSIKVTPETNATQYALYVTPIGDYTKPENGKPVDRITCDDNVADVTLDLTVSDETPYEQELISFTAVAYTSNATKYVADDEDEEDVDAIEVYTPVIGGTITLKEGDTTIGEYAVDSAGMVRVTIPAPAYGSTVTYKAIYSGTSTFDTAKDAVDVTSKSAGIATNSDDEVNRAKLNVYDESNNHVVGNVVTQGNAYTLKVENVISKDGAALVYGTAYLVDWYADWSGNGNYETLAGGTDILEITAENVAIRYKAVVVPIGHYTKPAQGIELFVGNTGDKYDVTTTIAVDETFIPTVEKVPSAVAEELLSGSHYGDEVKITATVNGSSALEVPTGFVRFSYVLGGETTILGTVELVDTGEEDNTSKAELITEELPTGVMDIKAEYLGSDVFYGANDEEHPSATDVREDYKVWSITIKDSSVVIQAYPVSDSGIPSDTALDTDVELTASKTYQIKLSDIYTIDDEKLDADEYTTQWFSRDEKTTEWLDITTDSSMTSVFVTPMSLAYGFKAVVTTTDNFYNDTHSGLADSATSNIIGSELRGSAVIVTIDPNESAYQANDVTIHAKVIPADGTGTPTGTVAFYYTDAINADEDDRILIVDKTAADSSKIAVDPVTNIAEIVTDSLPVKVDGTARDLYIWAVYSGDVNYEGQTGHYGSDAPMPYTIKSSVIDRLKVLITSPGTPADGAKTYLTLGPISTLDGEVLTYNIDYTVEWQKRPTASAGLDSWEAIPEGTSHELEINTEEDVQYRAKVTAVDTSIKAKASYINFNTNEGETVISPAQGTRENYSDPINVTKADAVIYTNIVPASSGALDGDDVVINANVYGGETTPVGEISVTVTDENGVKVFESSDNAVSGWNSFTWENAPAGVYNVETKYTSNNEYVAETINDEYVVRFTDHTLSINKTAVTYDGEEHAFTAANATVSGISDENRGLKAMAEADVVYTYYYQNKDGSETIVEAPVKAGTYTVKAWLPESKYWKEAEATAEFTVAKRQLVIGEIVALDKIYDGSTSLDVLKVEIPYADLDTNGVPSGNAGIVEGDSVYAVITNGSLNSADAGSRVYTVNGVTLNGPSADNYIMNAGYTQPVEVLRSQLQGEIASGIVIAPGQKISASQIKLISQNGANYTTGYTVSYYLHTGEQVIKVNNTNTAGLYTVVVTGGANYKGGASADVYVAKTGQSAGAFSNTVYTSSIVHIGNTEVEYGTANATGVTATATNGAAINEILYYVNNNDAGTTVVPVNAGRYIVKVTSSTDDYVYGLYTVHKSSTTLTPYDVANSIYGDNYTVNNGAEYVSYTGGRLTDVDYLKPVDAGKYLATYHYAEANNYVAYTVQDEFTISPKPMVITADRKYAELYTTAPSLKVTFDAADGGNGVTNGFEYLDSSLNAIIVQPTIIVGEADSENLDLNNSGLYDIIPSSAVAYNYTFDYVSQNMAKITTNPQETLEIVGVPQGTIQYGDEFRVGAYGNKVGTRTNDSSELTWAADGVAEVDELGNVTITGVGSFSITVTKGSGAYAISTTYEGVAVKKLVNIIIDDVDRAYNGTDKLGDSDYDFEFLVSGESNEPAKADCDVVGEPETSSGNYVVTADLDHDLYQGTGTGLLRIHKDNATVNAKEITKDYGTNARRVDDYYELYKSHETDKLLDAAGFTAANVLARTDAGSYKTFVGSGEEQYKNYNIGYMTNSYTVNRRALTFNTAVRVGTNLESNVAALKNAAVNTGTSARMYGEYNRILDFKANLVDFDTFADILSGSLIAEYDETIKSNANVVYITTDSYLTDRGPYKVNGVLEGLNGRNYNISIANAISNISQRPITVTINEPFSVDIGTIWKDAYTYTTITTAKFNNEGVSEGGLAQYTTYADPNYIYDTVSTLGLMPVGVGANAAATEGEHTFAVTNPNYWAGNTNTEQVFDSPDEGNTVHINVENISLSAVIYDKTTTSFKVQIKKDNVALSNIEGIQYTVTNTKTNNVEAAGTLQETANGYYLATYDKLYGSDYVIRFTKTGYNFNYSN
ncbi:MAG: hypothetical protein VB119_01525 [Candidatus Metalachnospira sp.]|nr:hypothetical protein [Candidatus Metalachnospira sp.]